MTQIKIDRTPQKVRTYREVELPDRLLTLNDIAEYIDEGEEFNFFTRDNGGLTVPVDYIAIFGYRDETEEEINIRIAKAKQQKELDVLMKCKKLTTKTLMNGKDKSKKLVNATK